MSAPMVRMVSSADFSRTQHLVYLLIAVYTKAMVNLLKDAVTEYKDRPRVEDGARLSGARQAGAGGEDAGVFDTAEALFQIADSILWADDDMHQVRAGYLKELISAVDNLDRQSTAAVNAHLSQLTIKGDFRGRQCRRSASCGTAYAQPSAVRWALSGA